MSAYLVYRRFRVVDKLQTISVEAFDGSAAVTADVSDYEKLMKCRLEEISEREYDILTRAYLAASL